MDGATTVYAIFFRTQAQKDLQHIHPQEQARIMQKVEALKDNLTGDIKRLTNFTPEYRLRVGNFRVLFEVPGQMVIICRIKHRREAYN